MTSVETLIRRVANRFGVDIKRYRPAETFAGHMVTMLRRHDVDLVFDVGANIGQFAHSLREAGYAGRIASFEPLPSAWQQLAAAARADPMWEISPPMALGREDGDVDINISGNSVSSSVLGMLDSHASAAPASTYVGRVRVPLRRLDMIAPGYMREDTIPFLKIDTQGYETHVLDGAPMLLKRAVGVQLELSLVPLYEGQDLYRAFIDRLDSEGYDLWAIWPGFTDPATGRMLQVDAVFFRRQADRPGPAW